MSSWDEAEPITDETGHSGIETGSDNGLSPQSQPGTWRPGPRLCIDWGKARIGVAACDRDGVLAYPVETVANDHGTMRRLRELVNEYEPFEILLGMPTDLRGRQGVAAQTMRKVGRRLAREVHRDIRLVDERLTTATASRRLAATGHDARSRKAMIDQAAAVAILENAIDIEKRAGRPPGKVIPAA